MDKPKILDQQGQERDWDWLIANFGTVSLERTEVPQGVNKAYRIVKLQVSEGPAVQIAIVADSAGTPLEGITVVRHWPGAPPLPGWSPPASAWQDKGVFGPTNVRGEIGFGMGRGDYYFPPNLGASAVWVADPAGPSDFISGLGMLGGTNHRHLDVYFQLEQSQESPPSPPTPPDSPPTAPPHAFAILDEGGQPRDLAWLRERYGTVELHAAPEGDAYRLTELREVIDVFECKVTVLDKDGKPLQGIPVSFRRRDGTAGHPGETGEDGTVRFPLENDTKYPVPGQGPWLTIVKKTAGKSDAVVGLGRVLGQRRHLDVTFKFVPAKTPPVTPPPSLPPTTDERWRLLFNKIDEISTMLEKRAG